MTKKKKRDCNENIVSHLNRSEKNSKTFWKTLNKPNRTNKNSIIKSGISVQSWVTHFKSIFVSDVTKPFPTNPSETGPLDYPIPKMCWIIPHILKSFKACGLGGLSNEMITN